MRPASPVAKPRDTLREQESAAREPQRENLQLAKFGRRELFLLLNQPCSNRRCFLYPLKLYFCLLLIKAKSISPFSLCAVI